MDLVQIITVPEPAVKSEEVGLLRTMRSPTRQVEKLLGIDMMSLLPATFYRCLTGPAWWQDELVGLVARCRGSVLAAPLGSSNVKARVGLSP